MFQENFADTQFSDLRQPWYLVYPEVSLFALPINLLLSLAFIIAIPGYIFLGISHILLVIGVDTFQQVTLLTDISLHGVNIPSVILIGFSVFALGVVVYGLQFLGPIFIQSFVLPTTIEPSQWSFSRVRKMISHSLYGHIYKGLLPLFFLWWVLFWMNSTIQFSLFAVAILIYLASYTVPVLLKEVTGIHLLDKYFELVGGYENGSIGRRLHNTNNSLTDIFTTSELQQLLSTKQYERYVKTE